MHQALEEEDLRFIVEAAKEKVKLDRERAYTMMEDSESHKTLRTYLMKLPDWSAR